jgi:glycine dehydrogenase subunit 2
MVADDGAALPPRFPATRVFSEEPLIFELNRAGQTGVDIDAPVRGRSKV